MNSGQLNMYTVNPKEKLKMMFWSNINNEPVVEVKWSHKKTVNQKVEK